MRKLVLAPHADDEVLGVGGGMARWASEGHEVGVVIVTRGFPPLYAESDETQVRIEARAAHTRLGVALTWFLDLPAAGLDTVPQSLLNGKVGDVVRQWAPDELYVPFPGDLHRDHQLVFGAGLVAARPGHGPFPRALLAYETLSETNWNAPFLTPGFTPTCYVDISLHLDAKLEAMACYRSQLSPAPHERSLEALRALATMRGATVDLPAAEALVSIRTLM
jgi:LmbE family N-acetylglucosaminyl deacetylase